MTNFIQLIDKCRLITSLNTLNIIFYYDFTPSVGIGVTHELVYLYFKYYSIIVAYLPAADKITNVAAN